MLLKYTILSVSLITVMAGAMIAPAIASIAAAFPNATPLQINILTSLHAGLVVPFSFFSGYLVKRFSKKHILMFSTLLYLVAGIGGSFSPSIEFMLATRALLGVAVGIMIPISITLISDYYEGEERTRTLGLQSAATNLGGIIAILVSGYLANFGWNFSFFAYGMAAFIFVLVTLFLPYKKPIPISEHKPANDKLDPRVFLLGIYMMLTFIVFFGIPSNMSLFLRELDVTDTVVNGIIIATCSVGGFLGGLSLAFFRRVLKSFFIPLQVSYMAVGFSLITFFNDSLWAMGAGVLILGFGYGSTVPVIFDKSSKIHSGAATATATALLVSAIYLGQFLSPVVLGSVTRWFGDGTVTFAYNAMTMGLILVAILLVVNRFTHISGLRLWLDSKRSKHLYKEIIEQQQNLEASLKLLNEKLTDIHREQTANRSGKETELDERIRQLDEKVSSLSTADKRG